MGPLRKARKQLAESSSSGFLPQGKFQQVVWQNDARRGGCEVQQRDLIPQELHTCPESLQTSVQGKLMVLSHILQV